MHAFLDDWVAGVHWSWLVVIFGCSIAILGVSADRLVELAVDLSLRTGLPRVIVGATVVSLGTTMPEAAVSVYAAFQGEPGLALGNAVGSIICDTGLILGLACLITPLPIDRKLVNRQGWIQFGAGVLLIACCIPWSAPLSAFGKNSAAALPQMVGWGFLGLLVAYMIWSVKQAGSVEPDDQSEEIESLVGRSSQLLVGLMFVACLFLVGSSTVLVSATKEMAFRADVPTGIISATVLAFGTSLPELVTAMTAVRRGHGELAVGNVIGADILNVLFVAGASASVTTQGLAADENFFRIQFPFMLLVLVLFRVGIVTARNDRLARPFGVALLVSYVVYLSYMVYKVLNGPSA